MHHRMPTTCRTQGDMCPPLDSWEGGEDKVLEAWIHAGRDCT